MKKQITNILKREFVDFVINTFEKHKFTTDRAMQLHDFFIEAAEQNIDLIKADLLIKGSSLPEKMAEEYGIKYNSSDNKLEFAANLLIAETEDHIRAVIVGKLENLHHTATEINNNNTYLSINPSDDIRVSEDASKFKQADIKDINNRIKILLTQKPHYAFIDVPLSRKENGTFHGDLNLSMFDLSNVRETIKEAKNVFPKDFIGRQVLDDISNYVDKNYPPHVKQKA